MSSTLRLEMSRPSSLANQPQPLSVHSPSKGDNAISATYVVPAPKSAGVDKRHHVTFTGNTTANTAHIPIPRAQWTYSMWEVEIKQLTTAPFMQDETPSGYEYTVNSPAPIAHGSHINPDQAKQSGSPMMQAWLAAPTRDQPYDNIGSVRESVASSGQEDMELKDADESHTTHIYWDT